MTEGKPTLHHLNNSQSQKILWLLEELQIDYDLKLYKRNESGAQKLRAPDELKQIHPMGKSPALVTADGRVIVESSVIAQYLINTYDKEGKFKGDPATGNDQLRDQMLSSFGNVSLEAVMSIAIFTEMLVKEAPFLIRPLFSATRNVVRKTYTTGEFEKMFSYLDAQLGDQDYFMGSHPGCADFLISWPMDMISHWKFVDLAKYPKINAWYERCHARDGWKRALEKGNGYDLNFMG